MGPRFSKGMSSSGVSQDKLNQAFAWIALYQSIVREHLTMCVPKNPGITQKPHPRYSPK
jgi:hypothetical protein